jgi:indolepyruvate ferredoxin oxidoreductase alpha subunit
MRHTLLGPAGKRHLLLGNEAIVRGALEAGVSMITCYPGTPSSEVPDTFRAIGGKNGNFRLEYSINEKVAAEVALGAAVAGVMSMATMKHVGVNVAADPLFTAAYTGVPGGFVLLCADDPSCHSSQNEQDNRYYVRAMSFPCLEPATAQEAKDMTKDAFALSRELEQPVMLRTTTRINHLRGQVEFGHLPGKPAARIEFQRNPTRFVPVPFVSRNRHFELVRQMSKAEELAEKSHWNRISGKGKVGVIASGVSRNYLADALAENGWKNKVKVLELGFTWPLPEKKIKKFMFDLDHVLVLEEGEPVLEIDIKAIAYDAGLKTTITGKGEYLTIFGEYSTTAVAMSLAEALGEDLKKHKHIAVQHLPPRAPGLCAGCAHKSVYYAVRKVFGSDPFYSGDIGCYTLGMAPPHSMLDFMFCMGSSISAGSGFAAASGKPVVAFIGDSTFFHSGLTGLVNAVFNQHNLLLVILDNGTTAMTGHQPHPGAHAAILGESNTHLDIESVVRGCGVREVAKVKPYNLKSVTDALEKMKNKTGIRVIISEEPCILFAQRTLKQPRKGSANVVAQNDSTLECVEQLACPAFMRDGDKISIDDTLCSGCMVCLQISPSFKANTKITK